MTSAPPEARTRPLWLVATVVAVVAYAVIWAAAVPREVACPAIYPAPPGCSVDSRESAGVLWSVVLGVVYAAALAVTLTVGRRRRSVAVVAVVVLAACAVLACGAVLFSTGFVL
jgi:cytochrome bd-type quinol oxidase subunit 2